MDETILLPSPHWFLASNLAISSDGWLIYGGGTNKSLCVLEPLKADVGIISGNDKYQAHVVPRAHTEKIVSVDLSPEWSEKRTFIAGSLDGAVKQWVLENVNNKIRIKATHNHIIHSTDKEEVVGVGYCQDTYAVSIGCFGTMVKWNLSSNITQNYPNFIKNFKPTCMACSLHMPLHVAVGTKQGVVFLVDIQGSGRILYKVRGHDDEVMNISWCPQYEVIVKKTSKESRSFLTNRLAAIRSEGEKEINVLEQSGTAKNLPEDSFDESIVQEDDMFDIYKDHEPDEFGHKKYEPEEVLVKVKKEKTEDSDFLAECLKLKEEILKKKNQAEPTIESLVDALDKTHVEVGSDSQAAESNKTDNASEKTNVDAGSSTETDKEDVQSQPDSSNSSTSVKYKKTETKVTFETSHPHKHLLASVGKFGGIRIWSKAGKLVSSCAIPNNAKHQGKPVPFSTTVLWYKSDTLLIVDAKNQLLECNPLHIDSKNKLEWRLVHALHKRGLYCIATNAPRIQTESTVPSDDWSIWSVAQDRMLIRYCLRRKKALSVHASCGGFLYTIQVCPYDAGKVAASVGDGAVRVLESQLIDDDTKLSPPKVTAYWQNVQGKVLTVAWHPTRENLLAFGTAEARVGLIDTSNRSDRPARALFPALNNSVYSLCWGEGMHLYASGGGGLVMYRANLVDEAPEQIDITLEGQKWNICTVSWTSRGLLVGSAAGAVAIFTHKPPHTLIAAAFIFNRMIHAIEWHPQQTSTSSEVSPYKDLLAVSSLDKEHQIVILDFSINEADGKKQLTTWKRLTGHRLAVLQLDWSPHKDELLLSSSQDSTIRVWDISKGTCVSILGNHSQTSLGVSWVSYPQLPNYVMSGGGDGCMRLWNIHQHKAEDYDGKLKHEVHSQKTSKKHSEKKEKKEKTAKVADPEPIAISEDQAQVATNLEGTGTKTAKPPKKFLLPIMFKRVNDPYRLAAPKKMLKMYIQKNYPDGEKGDRKQNDNVERADETKVDDQGDSTKVDEKGDSETVVEQKEENKNTSIEEENIASSENAETAADKEETDLEDKSELDFLKVFGSIREVNEVLDMEMNNHLEASHPEAWIMLSIFRGHIDTMIQFASQQDMLCPFLLSMAPCVSFKYWKDATQLYLAQIDRLVARGEEEKLYENREYGGPKYRKAAILLSMHDVMGAVNALLEGKLYKEAYILCRIRYMDSVAEEILKKWADDLTYSGNLTMAAVCYMVLDNMSQAAQVLSRSHDQGRLSLAADIAKVAGRTAFADHVEKRALHQTQAKVEKTEEILKELPSKIELLMKENKGQNSDNLESDMFNGETLNSDNLNGDTKINE